jgi:hypothetical protein
MLSRKFVEGSKDGRRIRIRLGSDTNDSCGHLVALSGRLIAAAPGKSANEEHCGNSAASARSARMFSRWQGAQEKPTSKLAQDNAPSDLWSTEFYTERAANAVAPVALAPGARSPRPKCSFAA